MVSEADRDKLVAFVHGELNPLEAERFAARLRTEEDLRLEYEALMFVDEQLEDLFLKPAKEDLSPEQVSTILKRAGGLPKTPSRRRFFYTVGGATMAACLAVVIWTKQHVSKPARFSTPAPMDAVDLTGSIQAEAPKAAAPQIVADSSESEKDLKATRSKQEGSTVADERMAEAGQTASLQNSAAPSEPQELARQAQPAAKPAASASAIAKAPSLEAQPLPTAPSAPATAVPSKDADLSVSQNFAVKAKSLERSRGADLEMGASASGALAKEKTDMVAQRKAQREEPLTLEQLPPEWFACRASVDCVLVEDFCVWRSVNKKFAKTFQESSRVNPYRCTSPRPDPARKATLRPTCKNLKCASDVSK